MWTDRRHFLRAGAAGCMGLGVAMSSTRCGDKTPAPAGAGSLRFNLTGLFIFELWTTAKKEMLVSLLDAKASGLDEVHAPVLIVNLKDYVWPELFGQPGHGPPHTGDAYQRPQIIRVGDEAFGVWGLGESVIWMGGAHEHFDSVDSENNLDFPHRGTDTTKPPNDWTGREWFIDAAEIRNASKPQPGPSPPLEVVPSCVISRIRFTRGSAMGVKPWTDCEQVRKYSLAEDKGPQRQYAAELRIDEMVGDITDLRISPIDRMTNRPSVPRGLIIRLRTPGGKATPVSIANTPIGRHSGTHFSAYSRALGFPLDKTVGLFVHEGPQCGKVPNAPEAGCIPPLILRG